MNIRVEQCVRSTLAIIVFAGCTVASIVADSVRFEHKTIAASLRDLNHWIFIGWAILFLVTALETWRFPMLGPASHPAPEADKPERVTAALRSVAGMSLSIGFLASGDVLVSQLLLRSIYIFPWMLGAVAFTNRVRGRWERRNSERLRAAQSLLGFMREMSQVRAGRL